MNSTGFFRHSCWVVACSVTLALLGRPLILMWTFWSKRLTLGVTWMTSGRVERAWAWVRDRCVCRCKIGHSCLKRAAAEIKNFKVIIQHGVTETVVHVMELTDCGPVSELGGLWKQQNNPECTKNVKCIRVVRLSVGHNTVYGRIVCWHSSGAVGESRWTSWAVRPNEPSGFRGRKDLLNRASALVTTCP